MFSHDYKEGRSLNFAQSAARIFWHFSSFMAFVSLLMNFLLHREVKRTILQVVHRIGYHGEKKESKRHLRRIRKAKEIISTLWAIGLGASAGFGIIGWLLGNIREE